MAAMFFPPHRLTPIAPSPFCTFDQARAVIARYERAARPMGYVLALFGSVLRDGAGNDVDVIAYPIDASLAQMYGGGRGLIATLGPAGFSPAILNARGAWLGAKGVDRPTGSDLDLNIIEL